MIEPLNVTREEFPKSEKRSEGMKILEKKYDNYEIWYHQNVVYVERPEAKGGFVLGYYSASLYCNSK